MSGMMLKYGSAFLYECFRRSLKWSGHFFLTSELWLRCAKDVACLEDEIKGLRGEWEKEEYRCPQCGLGNPMLRELADVGVWAEKLVEAIDADPSPTRVTIVGLRVSKLRMVLNNLSPDAKALIRSIQEEGDGN